MEKNDDSPTLRDVMLSSTNWSRSSPFQGGNTGSSPVESTIYQRASVANKPHKLVYVGSTPTSGPNHESTIRDI